MDERGTRAAHAGTGLRLTVLGAITRAWQEWSQRRTLTHRAIPDELWTRTLQHYPFLNRLSAADAQDLRELATLFLARKNFSGAQGLEVNDEMAVAIAAQAVLPVLKLGLSMYDGFVSIVVHPDTVVARRQEVDDIGVVHEYDEEIAGESMDGGPVMLSWRDVHDAGKTSTEGYNVTIHEFAHVIDAADAWGNDIAALGDPALHKRWSYQMQRLYERFCLELDGDFEWDCPLDPYAATSIGEFFAVGSEAFFVDPLMLRARMPTLYELLGALYRQDPAGYAPPP